MSVCWKKSWILGGIQRDGVIRFDVFFVRVRFLGSLALVASMGSEAHQQTVRPSRG